MLRKISDILFSRENSTPPRIALLEDHTGMRLRTGKIINLTDEAKAAGIDQETIRKHQRERFQHGLTSYAVEFEEPVVEEGGRVSSIASIAVDFGNTSLSSAAKENLGKNADVATAINPATGKRVVIAMHV